MKRPFIFFLCWLGRIVFSLRYKIQIHGDVQIEKRGALFLPNHTSRLDPLILLFYFWPKFKIRPVVVEYIAKLPLVRQFLKVLGGISIPNFDTSINQYKVEKAKGQFEKIENGLKEGSSFLLFPSGRIKRSGKEILGGSSGAHELLLKCPDAEVVLIRQVGFWGSRFSHAFGDNESFSFKKLGEGVLDVLKSFLFFTPKRKIDIYIEVLNSLPCGTRREFNAFLESWYNRYPEEVECCQWVPKHLWDREGPEQENLAQRKSDLGEIPLEVKQAVQKELEKILDKKGLEIESSTHLSTDLGMDSINVAEVLAFLSKKYGVKTARFDEMDTIADLYRAILQKENGIFSESKWERREKREKCHIPTSSTIPEALFEIYRKQGKKIACADDTSGEISYKKILTSSLILAEYFKGVSEKKMGVLLPASSGAMIVVFALLFAGKIPVMLNWTLGPKALEQMVEISGVETILSSWKFMERLNHVNFGEAAKKIELLEDLKEKVKISSVLKALWKRRFGIRTGKKEETAVLLFTSGSEGTPKAVPLSHKNILENQRSLMRAIEFEAEDVLLSILPPFHSLGLTVVGIFPILSGLKTSFFANPTDPIALANACKRWEPSWIVSPAFFLKELFEVAEKSDLASLKYVVSGGEKTPESLKQKCKELGAHLIEAYGTTECAPCVSIGKKEEESVGVGKILPGIEVHIEEGEVCIHGKNVFSGYLNAPSPFFERDGKKWYRTGDLGKVDEKGNLLLLGRIKRFVKIGGEMISLGSVEETLLKEVPEGTLMAVCEAESKEGKVRLILFSSLSLSADEANEILRKNGVSNLIKIFDVLVLDEFPIMGSGKINYGALKNQSLK